MYNRGWQHRFDSGSEDAGDYEQALQFLEFSGLMLPGLSTLEIGGGIGKLSNALLTRGFTNLTCTDLSEVSVSYGKLKYPNLNLCTMDACKLEFESNQFDRCISFDLVEHIPEIDKHLAEVARVLKPDGVYLFQTPNVVTNAVWETIQSRGFGWKVYHPSLQTASSLRRKLLSAGFTSVEFVKLAPITGYKLALLPKPLRMIFHVIPWRLLPMFLQVGFWTIARR